MSTAKEIAAAEMNATERVMAILHNVKPSLGDVSVEDEIGAQFDSLDIVTLIGAFEDEFGIEIDPDAIIPENFDSVVAMVHMVETALERG